MSYGEQAKKEITTIAPRTITLNLSDTDCRRLAEISGQVGMSAGELLQMFVRDLVGDSNGSDERMHAQAWFDRSGFNQYADYTLLRYLLKYGGIDDFLGHYDILQECQEDLLAEEPDNSPESNREEIEYQQRWLQECYDDYVYENTKYAIAPEPFDEGLARVLQWKDELDKLLTPAKGVGQQVAAPEPEHEPELD